MNNQPSTYAACRVLTTSRLQAQAKKIHICLLAAACGVLGHIPQAQAAHISNSMTNIVTVNDSCRVDIALPLIRVQCSQGTRFFTTDSEYVSLGALLIELPADADQIPWELARVSLDF